MVGMMMSFTSEVTIAPNAAPMMTPTARSTTLPFIANSRNSFSMAGSVESSVDQAGMHHGAAHGNARRLGDRHHRQPQLLVHLAEQRHGVLDRRRTGLHEQIGVQRHQLVVQLERRLGIALLPGDMK